MDTYNKNKHTSETKSLSVDAFYINDIPVCMSWYGSESHPREACQFLQSRKFGTVLVCGVLCKDINDESEKINKVLDDCPIHYPKI